MYRLYSVVRHRPPDGEEDAELFGASGVSAVEACTAAQVGRVHRHHRRDPGPARRAPPPSPRTTTSASPLPSSRSRCGTHFTASDHPPPDMRFGRLIHRKRADGASSRALDFLTNVVGALRSDAASTIVLGGCSAVKHMFARHGLLRQAELVLSLSGAPELRR